MVGLGVERFVAVARRWRSQTLVSGNTHSVVLLTVGTLACRAIGVGPSGVGSLAVQVMGVSLVVRVGGNGVQAGVGGWSEVWCWRRGEGFGQGGVGSAMGGVRWFGPTGRDQAYVPQGEPTFRKGGGAQGLGKNAGVPGAGVGGYDSEKKVSTS